MTCGDRFNHCQQSLGGGTPADMPVEPKQQCPTCHGFLRSDGGCTKCEGMSVSSDDKTFAAATAVAPAVGGGDTELVQMTGRRSGGNCPNCGQFMSVDGGHTCPPRLDDPSITEALDKAIAADERRNFVVVDGVNDYFPLFSRNPEIGITEIQHMSENGGMAALYAYDTEHHPANDPRRPVAIFHDGKPAMVTESVRDAVEAVQWQKTSEAFHGIMYRLDRQSEIPTAGPPAKHLNQLDSVWSNGLPEDMRHALDETREIIASRADEAIGFTVKDAELLRKTYLAELDRRIEAKARPAMDEIYEELGQGYWEEGYTEDDVQAGCEHLNKVARDIVGLPGEVAVMWSDNGEFGFSGDSELVYLHHVPTDPDAPDDWMTNVEAYSLPIPFFADADPDDFISGLRRIARGEAKPDAVYGGDEVTYDGYNWGPFYEDEHTWRDWEGDTDES